MQEVAVVGLDLAKNVFQVHGLTVQALRWCASSCEALWAEIEHLEWVDPTAERADMAPLNTDFVFPALLAH